MLERWYRSFPGRLFILPLMACTCATVYFAGTWYDLGFSAVCGLAAGLVAWSGTIDEQFWGVMDYLAAIAASMISVPMISLSSAMSGLWEHVDVTLPYAEGELLARVRERGTVEVEYGDRDVHIEGRVVPSLAGELRAAAARWDRAGQEVAP